MASTALERRSATWEEYEALGEDVRAEYIDGEIVMSPPPSIAHQRHARRLADLLDTVLPAGFETLLACAWKPGSHEFIPDVMVIRTADVTEPARFTGEPALCIEVVSGNRSNDYVTKTHKYAEAGLDHYWILDPRDPQLDILVREGQHYVLETQLFAGDAKEVSFGIAIAPIDLDALLSGT